MPISKKDDPNAIKQLLNYDWPGNVRELQNVLEGGVQLADGEEIDYGLIAHYLENVSFQNNTTPPSGYDRQSLSGRINPYESDSPDELVLLEYMLRKHKYNKTDTAKAMGISRQWLYKLLRKYSLI